jgi:hypothetical protein
VLSRCSNEELLAAAAEVGEVEEVPIFDKDGKPTDKTLSKATGKGGLRGYLRWAAVHRANAFIPQLGRVMPLQVNVKDGTKPARTPFRSVDEIKAALRAKGIDPDVIERSMEPKFIQEQRKKEELRAALRERGIEPDILEAAPDVIAAIGTRNRTRCSEAD